MTGWRKVCDVEQGGGPFRPGKFKGNPGSGSLSRLSKGFWLKREKIRHRPQTSTLAKERCMCTGFEAVLISTSVSARILHSRAVAKHNVTFLRFVPLTRENDHVKHILC